MMKILYFAVLALSVLSSVNAFGLPRPIIQRREDVMIAMGLMDPLPDSALPPAQFYNEQRLDHFDHQSIATYAQRYFVNDTFYKPGGPVFLYIEGEGAASPYDALVGEHMELAAKFGALVFAVEHRYYGASVPTEDMSTPNMKWLSSQQALADLAQFHAFATQKWNLEGATWICYGGSYPGALSAWFREKYPHLVYGAVASSAPVRAKLNFEGYNDVVAASLATELVGGSAECAANVNTAFDDVAASIQTVEGRTNLSAAFPTCQPLVSAEGYDSQVFMSNLAGAIMGIVQYNAEIPGRPTIADICKQMTTPNKSPFENLVAGFKMLNAGQCVDTSFADSLVDLLNTTADKTATGVGIRQWTYQTCTQFGFYQTCDANTTCPFGKIDMTLASNTLLCEIAFGIQPSQIQPLIDFSNDYYGADNPDGSRILFVNGRIDPWHYLSVLEPISGTTENTVFINGTAHCANMMPSSPNDPPQLVAARTKISNQVGAWIKAADMAKRQ